MSRTEKRSPLNNRRLLVFVLTTVVAVFLLRLIPVDDQRAEALTASKLSGDDILAPLASDYREALELDDDEAIGVVFRCDCEPAVKAELRKVVEEHFDIDDTGPVLEISARRRDNHIVLMGSLDSVSETHSGTRRIGDWRSILPPLCAILLALFFHRVLLGLVSAIFLGAILHFEGHVAGRLVDGAHDYYWASIANEFSLYIVGFTCALVGMVIVATRAGGSQGLIDVLTRIAESARSTRIATALMGLAIFFDDYANTIVVGTTVRPMSDRRRISREKLAYIVDSTAAPIAGLALISTWIAFEVGILDTLIDQVGLVPAGGEAVSGYSLFVTMVPLRFYCLFCLFFVFVGAISNRDYGPMLKAERRAALTGEVLAPTARPLTSRSISEILPEPGIKHRWYFAVLPVLVVIISVLVGMLWSGRGGVEDQGVAFSVLSFDTWKYAFGEADPGPVLFYAALLGSAVAITLAVGSRTLGFFSAIVTWARGLPAMALAISILISAWAIQSVCTDLGTNVFLVSAIGDSVPPLFFPVLTFLLAAGVAFATGTSWGTMGILLPIILPWAWNMVQAGDASFVLVLLSSAAVLDGAIMGDHCSPISDTTVMSSMASSCDHMDHVRTQMPYALTCMGVAALAYLGAASGISWWIVMLAGLALIVIVFMTIGKTIPIPEEQPRPRV